jgi:cold shock CspA family protein
MGKPISSNKRELEKKREQKRVDKQKRKEARKANSGDNSFENMIAYVDENGLISDQVPDKKSVVNAEDIAVSTLPKQKEELVPLKGRVEHFNQSKGYGFIKDLGSTEKYFFHISDAFPDITEGSKVGFELEKGRKGMNAVRIVQAD